MHSIIDGTRVNLDFKNSIEDVIIVGVGSGRDLESWQSNRTYEFTQSQDSSVKRYASGGAEKFLNCLKKEIIPFVDEHYKTNSDNGIMGHSLAGLFVTYCFVNSPDSFDRYAMSSPSLMWKESEMLKQAERVLLENKISGLPFKKAFVSVGGEEETLIISGAFKFCSMVKERNYENLDLTWHVFEGETHMSVVSGMISRALSTLYDKK